MRKFLIIEAIVASVAVAGVMGYAMASDQVDGIRVSAFGARSSGTNEYGCMYNCTAEYEINHVYRLFENKPSGYSIDGVRFKVKFASDCAGNRWFQDCWDLGSYKYSAPIKSNLGSLLMLNGREQGLNRFKSGDTVCFFATISRAWSPWGIQKVLYAENPTFYRVNDKEDLSLLETPVYIPE